MSTSCTELDGFQADPRRDASAAIRGFYFQIVNTVVRWLELPLGHALICESGEDIDEVFRDVESASLTRILGQLKVRRAISLRSAEALTAMFRFYEHRRRNPGAELHYRFCTTATAQVERGTSFPQGLPGIQAWERARRGGLSQEERTVFVAMLRRVVIPSPEPTGLSPSLYGEFISWIQTAPSEEILEFVGRLGWAMEEPNTADQEERIREDLLRRGIAGCADDARSISDLLIAHVLRLLTQVGEKRLTPESLLETLADRAALEGDRRLLRTFRTTLDGIQESLRSIELATSRTERQTALIEKILADLPGASHLSATGVLPLADEPPEPPALFVSRSQAEQALKGASLGDWTWLFGAGGMGKTSLAAAVLPGVSHSWISLNPATEEPSPESYLGRQLVRLSVTGEASPSLRDRSLRGSLSLRELVSAAVGSLPPGGTLVIDDIPELTAGCRLLSQLEVIGREIRAQGRRLITTSQYRAPTALRRLPLHEVEVPSLSEGEIAELLAAADAPESFRTPRFIALMLAFTKGHPTLCQAAVAYLRSSSWQLDTKAIEALFRGEPWEDVKEESLRCFVHVSTPAARELTYRLSLIDQPFQADLAWSLAAIPPDQGNAQELLDSVLGPWVVRMPGRKYALSALLAGSGERMLPRERREAVHRAIAERLLTVTPIDQFDAVRIVVHLVQGRGWTELAVFLLSLALQVNDRHAAEAFEFITRLDMGRNLPADLPAHEAGAILGCQIRILGFLGRDSSTLMASLDRLASSGTDVQLFLPMLMAGPLNVGLGPGTKARRTLSVARMFARLPEDLRIGAPGVDLEAILWLGSPEIQQLEDMRELLSVLREMTPPERRRAIRGALFEEGGTGFLDRAWRLELRKAPEKRNWPAVFEILTEGEAVAALDGAAWLHPLVLRARAIVLSEQGRREEALAAIDEAIPGADRDGRLLLRYTAGCLQVDGRNDAAAFATLTAALDDASPNLPVYRSLARRLLIEPAARVGQLELARTLIVETVHDEEIPPTARVRLELLGELAWVLWLMGQRQRSIGSLASLVLGLRRLDAGDERRELEVKAGHVLSQLETARAREKSGEPPSALDVFTGVFLTPNSVLVTVPGERPLYGSLLLLGRLAASSNAFGLASYLLGEAEKLADADPRIAERAPFHALILHELACLEARAGRFVSAFSLALSFARLAPELQRLRCADARREGGEGERCGHVTENRESRQGLHEEVAMGYAVAPAILAALSTEASSGSARSAIDSLDAALLLEPVLSSSPGVWSSVFSELRAAFSPLATTESIEGQIQSLGADQTVLRALLALAVSLCPEAPESKVAGYQAVAFDVLLSRARRETGVLVHATHFVGRHWARRTVVPDAIRARLNVGLAPRETAAFLVSLVAAMHVRIPEEIKTRLVAYAEGSDDIVSSEASAG